MSDLKRLGANIRSLRMAYGESQEKLGEAIYVEKNTVSNYESGKREPGRDTLTAIARHYMVSVEELLNSDYTHIGKIAFDNDVLLGSIDIIFPIVSSEKAMQNESFKRAFEVHKAFYDQLGQHETNDVGIDEDVRFYGYMTDVCINGYMTAAENNGIKAEAAVNLVAMWYLLMIFLKKTPAALKNQPAALRLIAAKEVIEDIASFEVGIKAVLRKIDNDEMKEKITEMLTVIKRSKDWSDLADYYLALQYVFDLADNNLDRGFNQRIGAEMMGVFASVKNIYAARYLRFCIDSFMEGSQFVYDN